MKLLRNPAVLIAIVCLAPAVLGWLVYASRWDTGARGNYGELVAPRSLSGSLIDAVKGKWALVVFDAAACDAECEKKLYIVRQIRRAQGKDMERIERVWVLTDAGTPRAALLEAIEGTRVVKPPQDFVQRFPGDPASDIYLVDPLGNLMMRYPRDPEPTKMIKDLQRLLRYSRIE
jgi:cytochrome oxidase Cu insertion factor (SCO1/SenC/PrrC family)